MLKIFLWPLERVQILLFWSKTKTPAILIPKIYEFLYMIAKKTLIIGLSWQNGFGICKNMARCGKLVL